MPMSYGTSICLISRHLRPVQLLAAGSPCRVPAARARLRFNEACAAFAVPREKLADITIAISGVPLEIDLCHDSTYTITVILVEAAGVAKQAQRILRHLAPRAPPFYDQKQFVHDCRKQRRLDRTEQARSINDQAVVTLAQLA